MSISSPSHSRTPTSTDDWITPQWLIARLGPFDLDPCACIPQPWACAAKSFTIENHGLLQKWDGFVYLNPPYGKHLGRWLERLASHDHGIALVFARVETKAFFQHVWGKASAVLFLRGRLTFNLPDGSTPRLGANSGGPSVLIAYGSVALSRLHACRDLGQFIAL